ncbi:MAG: Hsp20/alpha crystallin family protein [Spirochaetota bacterium]|nr:Hsp20/alpha crystallin family protein [Spirochaetota bacterium]
MASNELKNKGNSELKKESEYKKHIIPDVDTFETDNDFILKADMPGVGKDDLEVLLEEDTLSIKGEVHVPEDNLAYQEFEPFVYYRTFRIGSNINREKVEAKMDNGVLTLVLPKSEIFKPRKIKIES